MKHITRLLITLLVLTATAVFINVKTPFFKDIGRYIPYLEKNHPYVVKYISDCSDKVNEFLSHIPTPSELIAKIRNTELPIDPDDIAKNIYYSSDTMLNFYNEQNVSVAVNDNELDVYGVFCSPQDKHIVYRFLSDTGEVLKQYTDLVDSEGKFRKIMQIPENSFQLAIFTGPERYGEFSSRIYNYIYFSRSTDGIYSIAKSPVYDHNITEYEKNKSLSSASKNTYAICSDDSSVKSVAEQITAPYATNYEKALALHDWVCENIYYDSDSISGNSNTAPYVASDVIQKKRAVCLGYSNLYAALCRAAGIPCNVVTGYALGVSETETTWNNVNLAATEANHAWNEVYLDSRWVIVDTTWDSQNKIENGEAKKSDYLSHLYFDANMRFFSANHKILEYVKR